jgi:hypothetical protein
MVLHHVQWIKLFQPSGASTALILMNDSNMNFKTLIHFLSKFLTWHNAQKTLQQTMAVNSQNGRSSKGELDLSI